MLLKQSPEQKCSDVIKRKREEIHGVNSMHISLKALIKIMSQYTTNEFKLETTIARGHPTDMIISIPGGFYDGYCIYDLVEKQAWGISLLWMTLLEEAKLDATENRKANAGTKETVSGQS